MDDWPSTYAPPLQRTETYILKRQVYLADRAKKVAKECEDSFHQSMCGRRGFNPKTRKERDYRVSVVASDARPIVRIMDAYFTAIDAFKISHDMPTTELANECKRAAAWLMISRDFDLWKSVFVHDYDDGLGPALRASLEQNAPIQLILTLVFTELNISEKRVDADTIRLLIHNIAKRSEAADFDWLVLNMHELAKAFGSKRKPKGGASGGDMR